MDTVNMISSIATMDAMDGNIPHITTQQTLTLMVPATTSNTYTLLCRSSTITFLMADLPLGASNQMSLPLSLFLLPLLHISINIVGTILMSLPLQIIGGMSLPLPSTWIFTTVTSDN
jgi:hypothetical protein